MSKPSIEEYFELDGVYDNGVEDEIALVESILGLLNAKKNVDNHRAREITKSVGEYIENNYPEYLE